MNHLIKKNLSIHKGQSFIYIGLLVFFFFFNKDPVFIVSFVSALIVMNEFYFDEKADGDKLWNSLPFTRNEIVTARYMSPLLATLSCALLITVFEGFIGNLGTPEFWKQLIGSALLVMVSAAICFPIIYWLSKRKVVFTIFILYVLAVLGGSYLFYYAYLYIHNHFIHPGYLTDSVLFSVATLVTISLYFISWRFSVHLYEKRDII